MSVVAYTRMRMLWGAIDWQHGSDSPYTAAQTTSGGTDAVSGVGVRRVQVVVDRTLARSGVDAAVMHFDILNITGGNPDDTWTTGDFTNVETAVNNLLSSFSGQLSNKYRFSELRFYRIGEGVGKPNPAERVTTISQLGTKTATFVLPQAACSLTFRTAVRASWGRTYLPLGALLSSDVTNSGEYTTTVVDMLAAALAGFVTQLATSDFHLVVYSPTKHATLNVEKVEVDSNLDVIRRRRWKSSTYKKILP